MLVSILLFGLGAQKVHFRSELFTGIRFWQATVRLTIFTWMYSGVLGKVPVTGETGLWEVWAVSPATRARYVHSRRLV